MSARGTRVRRVDALERRLVPKPTWPMVVVIEDPDDVERRLAELERLHGPRIEGGPLFVMTGPRRRPGGERRLPAGLACSAAGA